MTSVSTIILVRVSPDADCCCHKCHQKSCKMHCDQTYRDFCAANNPGASESTGAGGEGAAGGGGRAGEENVSQAPASSPPAYDQQKKGRMMNCVFIKQARKLARCDRYLQKLKLSMTDSLGAMISYLKNCKNHSIAKRQFEIAKK